MHKIVKCCKRFFPIFQLKFPSLSTGWKSSQNTLPGPKKRIFRVSQLSENYHFNTVVFESLYVVLEQDILLSVFAMEVMALMSVKCSHVTFIYTNNKWQSVQCCYLLLVQECDKP